MKGSKIMEHDVAALLWRRRELFKSEAAAICDAADLDQFGKLSTEQDERINAIAKQIGEIDAKLAAHFRQFPQAGPVGTEEVYRAYQAKREGIGAVEANTQHKVQVANHGWDEIADEVNTSMGLASR
jgi:hypothetical protein